MKKRKNPKVKERIVGWWCKCHLFHISETLRCEKCGQFRSDGQEVPASNFNAMMREIMGKDAKCVVSDLYVIDRSRCQSTKGSP